MSIATLGPLRRPKSRGGRTLGKPALYLPAMRAAVEALGGKFTMAALVAQLRRQEQRGPGVKSEVERWISGGYIGNQVTLWRETEEIALANPAAREFAITEKWRSAC